MEVGLLGVSVTTHRAWYVNQPCINAMDSLNLKKSTVKRPGQQSRDSASPPNVLKSPRARTRYIYNPSLCGFVPTNASEDIPAAITERQSRGRRI